MIEQTLDITTKDGAMETFICHPERNGPSPAVFFLMDAQRVISKPQSSYKLDNSLVFPLSFLLFGLGFLGILVQREHRAMHDLIAGSVVIYAWDARAARLRFLARQSELASPPQAHSSEVTPPPAPDVIVTQ